MRRGIAGCHGDATNGERPGGSDGGEGTGITNLRVPLLYARASERLGGGGPLEPVNPHWETHQVSLKPVGGYGCICSIFVVVYIFTVLLVQMKQ